MGIGSLLFGLALLLVVATLIVLPLLDRKRPVVAPASPRLALEAERREIIRAIRDLDMDHRSGKMAEQDYRQLRADQVQRGAEVLRRLDALEHEGAFVQEDERDRQIEAAVSAARRAFRLPADGANGASLGAATAVDGAEPEACPSCGRAARPDDRFCPQCGNCLIREKPA